MRNIQHNVRIYNSVDKVFVSGKVDKSLSNMSQQLEPISLEIMQEFQKCYRQNWPKYCPEFYCLDNFIGFLKKDPQIKNLKAYTLSDERAKDEAFFVIVDRYQLFVGCLNNSLGLVEAALTLLDWSTGLKCSSIPARHIAALESVVEEKQLQLLYKDLTNLHYLPAEEARQLCVVTPAGFYLDTLRESDAELVNEEWPNHHEGSLYFVQRQIKLCPSVGLYAEDSKQLVAWCIRLQGGYLGALQVRSLHQRRGFGSLVTKEIARRIGCLGQDVMALVNPQNTPSRVMFDKLGFKVIDQCHWLRTRPLNGEFTWPEGE